MTNLIAKTLSSVIIKEREVRLLLNFLLATRSDSSLNPTQLIPDSTMLLLLFLLGLAMAVELPPDDHDMKLTRGTCPPFWFSFNDCCYKYVGSRLKWADAELNCVSQGANLVSIRSLQENSFVSALIKNFDPLQGHTWIGLSDSHKEQAWMWSDGSRVNFQHWCPGEPNNLHNNENCAQTNFCDLKKSSKWNDENCLNAYPSVCILCPGCPRKMV